MRKRLENLPTATTYRPCFSLFINDTEVSKVCNVATLYCCNDINHLCQQLAIKPIQVFHCTGLDSK